MMLLAAMLLSWASGAQSTNVSVGNWGGTSSSAYGGFHNTSRYSWTQTLYPATDMQGAGWIQAIILDNRSTAPNTLDSAKIYLGTTTMTTQPTSSVSTWVPASDLSLVWSRTSYTIPDEEGMLVIELDQPYYYDGTSTLALVVSKAAAATSSNTKFGYTSTTASMKYTGGTTESYCRFPTVAGTNSTYKENIIFVKTASQNDAYCLPLQGVHVAGATSSTATFAWNGTPGASYEVCYAGFSGNHLGVSTTATTDTFYTFTGLETDSVYWLYVRKQCSNGVSSGWDSVKVRTLMEPYDFPLSYDFDDPDDDNVWAIENATNGWVIDSVDGRRAMFISNDGTNNSYTVGSSGYSWAWIDVDLSDAGTYGVSFDWRAHGEGNYDYLRVALVPTSTMFSAIYGDNPVANTFRTQLPAGWINLSNATDGQYKLNLSGEWQHFGGEVEIADSLLGYYHLAIIWVNDGSGGTQPPAAIDNFMMSVANCSAPSSYTVSDLTSHSATLDVVHDATSSFTMVWHAVGSDSWDTVEMSSASHSFDNLMMGTTYEGLVFAICGSESSMGGLPFSFTTTCGTLTSDDLPYTETFEAYGTGSTQQINPCWTKGTNSSTAYPYPYSTAAVNGVRGLYFYATRNSSASSTSYYSWAALPPIDDELDMSDLMVSFMMKRYSTTTAAYHSMVAVGVADSVTNLSDADALDTLVTWIDTVDITDEAASSIHSAEVSFDGYTGNGKYVVFYAIRPDAASATQYNQFYLDDITLRTIPNCFWPSEVVLNSVTNEGTTITWTPDPRTSSPSSWEVEYGEEGFEPGTGNTTSTTDTTLTLTDLTPNTAYDVYIRANCGGDISDPAVFAFRTLCNPVATDSLPYVEDFESYASGSANGISPCWYKQVIGSATQYPYPSTTAASSGSIGLYAYSTSSFYSYAVLPVFEASLSDLMIEFDLKRGTSSGSTYHTMVYVGVMTVADDLSTFDTIAFIDDSENPASSVTHHLVSLEGYEGTGRIALLFPSPASSHYNYAYVDSVVVNQLPACRWPMNVAVDSVGAYEIDLSWTGSASNFEVQVSTTPEFTTATTTSTTVSATEAALTGLTPYTQYYLRVRGVCGSDVSFWSEVVPVITSRDCGPNNINIVDTVGDGTSSTYTYTFYGYSSYFQGYSSAIYTVTELNDMGLQVNNRINGIKLHSGTTGGTIRDARIYVAETSLEGYSTTPANDTVDRSTMTLVYSGDLVVPANSWVEIPFEAPFNYSGNSNLLITFAHDTNTTASVTFYYTSASPDYLNCYGYRSSATTANLSATRSYNRPNVVFDICTEIPNCVRPSNVALVSYSDTAASLQWDNVASSYEVALSTSSVNPDSTSGLTTYTVATNSIDLTGLTPNTEYYVYVRSLCGAIGNSEWSIELSFRTACAPQSLPFTEDFESYASGSSSPINPCWTKGTNSTTAYPYPYSTNAVNGSRSLYFYAYRPSSATSTPYYSYAALPMMDAPIDSLMVTFSMRRYSTTTDYYTSRLLVGVMTNPDDIATFTAIDTIDLKNEASLSIHNFEIPLSSYTGSGRYIAFYDEVPPLYGTATYSYSYVYLDDVQVDYLPTCPRVNGVQVTGISQTGATVSWNAVAGAASYDIEYGPEGFVHGNGITVTATTTSATLSGLAHSSPYDVYVRAHCSATDAGHWSFVTTFATECGSNSLPIVMDFEGLPTGTTSELPHCWTKWNDNMTASSGYYPYVYNSTTNAHSGTNCLYWYFSTSTTSYPSDMIFSTPAIDTVEYPMNTVEAVFWAKRSTNPMSVVVGVIADPNDATTFTAVDTIELTATLTEYTVPLSSYTGYGNHVAFRGTHTGTLVQYIYLDDITIEAISACGRAFDPTVTAATATTAQLAWTDTIGSSQWVVSWRPDTATAWTEVTVNDNPYTLTGLTPNTLYRFRVAPVCLSGERADWSRTTCLFTTSQVPASIPYSYNFEEAAEWNNWQTASNSTTNWVRGNGADGNSTHAMYLSADGGATQSWNFNTLTNAVAYRDIDFGSTVHSYQIDFDAYYGGTIGHNYDGLAVLLVSPAEPVMSSSTALITPWGHVNDVALLSMRHDTLWGHYTAYFDGVSGVQRVVFYHFNQATAANYAYEDNPAAVDNIAITLQPCERPGQLTVDTVTPYTAQLSWAGDATANYQVAYRVRGTSSSTNVYQSVSGTTAYLAGLQPATDYYWWVRRVCTLTATDTLVSPWSVNSAFSTGCAPISVADTLFEDFESYTPVAYNNTTAGELPNCWSGYITGPTGYVPHVTDSGSYSYCISGRQAITMTAGTPTSYGSDTYLRLADIAEPTNSLTLAFWMCTESSSNGFLEVGYLTGDDYTADFVSLKHIAASSATLHSGNGLQDATHGIRDTVSFDSVPAGNFPIVLRWNYTTSFYSVCIDDVAIWTNAPACETPAIDMTATTVGETTLDLVWAGSAANYEVVCVEGNWTGLEPTTAVTGNSHSFTGLTEATTYTVALRAVCAASYYSPWTTYTFTTLEHPCFVPTALTVTNATYDGATVSWTPGEAETEWEVNISCTSPVYNQTYTVSGTPQYVATGLDEGVTYKVAVRSNCGNGRYSDWSDTVDLAPLACEVVTGLTKTSGDAHSVTISWTSTGASKYEVDYGDQGHTDGNGTIVETTTNSITINGLESESTYDIYVRQYCTDEVYSQWSSMLRITTDAEQGIDDVESARVTLYPNPASQMVTIGGIEGEATVSIVDMNGREVYRDHTGANGHLGSTNSASESLTLDLTGYAKGAYFVRITGERTQAIRKLIVK